MDYQYSVPKLEKASKASMLLQPISFKQSCEVATHIRGKKVSAAIITLQSVLDGKAAIPYRKFNSGGVGHRKGIGTGRYPMKTCTHFIRLLKDAVANAQNIGLDTNSLYITHISAKKGSKSYHYGRQKRRLMKRTHLEVMVSERAQKEKKKTVKQATSKESTK